MSAPGWMARAACAQPAYDGRRDLWFAPTDSPDAAEAKQACTGCPVRQACLTAVMAEEGAANRQDRYGIRAGLTGRERRRLYEVLRERGQTQARERAGLAPCGTRAAYRRHHRRGEKPCEPCRRANAEQERRRTGPQEPSGCGTRAGYRRHRDNGEAACEACRGANAAADRRYRLTGTTKAAS